LLGDKEYTKCLFIVFTVSSLLHTMVAVCCENLMKIRFS